MNFPQTRRDAGTVASETTYAVVWLRAQLIAFAVAAHDTVFVNEGGDRVGDSEVVRSQRDRG